MRGKELEKELKIKLSSYFNENDYSHFHWYENTYFRKSNSKRQIILEIQSKSQSIGGFTEFGLTIWAIEEIIKEIGFPNINSGIVDKWYPFTKTIIDNNFTMQLARNQKGMVSNLEELELFCKSIISYMETEGKAFVERYSYLPNILKEMDRLVAEGKYWNGMYGKGGILTGLGDSYFRGLIISRLCNDINYKSKLEWVRNIFEEDTQWIPYYEKIKERLKSVDPIYNV